MKVTSKKENNPKNQKKMEKVRKEKCKLRFQENRRQDRGPKFEVERKRESYCHSNI